MKRLIVLSLTSSLMGCGTYLPPLTSDKTLPLDVLIAKIDCEFQVAVWTQKFKKGRKFLKGWQSQYTVTLKSNEVGSTRALSNTFPFVPSKTLAINASAGAGVTTTANRTALMKFSLAFDRITREPICAKAETSSLHPFITGRLGFEEWMNRAFDAAEFGGRMQTGDPQGISSLGHTFEFGIDVNANAGAGFVIGPAPTINVNPSATASRFDDGVVEVALSKPAVDPLPELIVALTKEEREVIAQLRRLIAELESKITKNAAILNKPENKELVDRMTAMRMPMQGIRPDDSGQQRDTGLNREQLGKLRDLNAIQEENQSAEREIARAKKEISDTKPTPQVVIRSRVLPPERNPEIFATTQQLGLERLINNLRVVP